METCKRVVGVTVSRWKVYCGAPAKKSHLGPRCCEHYVKVVAL
jgi:hypothetical protein